ncbi:unnamed protein product [Rotaria sordida]|uniref:Uncharacterized protein n=1 Tax=Rotaria sordida TaxID=392033 RepID=A0A819P279_9BILA|nr:unnamed protein product [Rotaria sordida]CAF1307210.1 unnamed protein product [Rotaria sordida]CAF1392392.1 unnamed protein product [Rotaria sordida]CAF4007833.1 unnamed protein product [Rotaria sordida]CAF4089599.1 unnamed protein product [Rotaria sordida]
MSLTLHGHHILLIATLAFATAVLTPNWYTSPDFRVKRNIFQICDTQLFSCTCRWVLYPISNDNSATTIFPIVVASLAIACAGISLIGLLLSSWYVERFASDIGSKWLLVLIIISIVISFLLSCGVWSIMLTTNLYQNDTNIKNVRLEDFGFSFWINIGASATYLYTFCIYLIIVCRNC